MGWYVEHLQIHTFEFEIAVRIATSNLQKCHMLRTGKNIRMMREHARLSQAVFARYLNLTVGYV